MVVHNVIVHYMCMVCVCVCMACARARVCVCMCVSVYVCCMSMICHVFLYVMLCCKSNSDRQQLFYMYSIYLLLQ